MGGFAGRFVLDEYLRGSCGTMPAARSSTSCRDLARLGSRRHQFREDLHTRALPLLNIEYLYGPAIYKEVLRLRGIISTSAVRDPGAAHLDARDREELDAILLRMGDMFAIQSTGREPGVAGGGARMRILDLRVLVVGNAWKNWVLVALDCDNGETGIGEATLGISTLPVTGALEELRPIVLGEDPLQTTRCGSGCFERGITRPTASSRGDECRGDRLAGTSSANPSASRCTPCWAVPFANGSPCTPTAGIPASAPRTPMPSGQTRP